MLTILLILIVVLPLTFIAFVIDAHINNVCNIQLAKKAAERDQMAAASRSN